MITMQDVAQRAGVSKSTVSFVLNNRQRADGTISEDTRQRVMEAASALGYRRNELARAVGAGKSRMIGFLATDLAYEPVARMMAGALTEAQDNGYTLKVLRMEHMSIDDAAIQHCIELRLSGVLVVYQEEGSVHRLYQEMSQYKVPVAILDNSISQPWAARVISDDVEGTRLAIEHLVALGHQRIACISGAPFIVSAVVRADSYRAAMTEFGLAVPDDYIAWADWEIEPARRAARQLLNLPAKRRPTAIFCAGDLMAMVAIREARKMGLRIPEDLSVVGYADFKMASLCDPALTTVAQPFEQMGQIAVQQLWSYGKGDEPGREKTNECIVPTQLVVRDSTAPPAA
jgi:DNA-binding LacI/PurR family transcriptional regulator